MGRPQKRAHKNKSAPFMSMTISQVARLQTHGHCNEIFIRPARKKSESVTESSPSTIGTIFLPRRAHQYRRMLNALTCLATSYGRSMV